MIACSILSVASNTEHIARDTNQIASNMLRFARYEEHIAAFLFSVAGNEKYKTSNREVKMSQYQDCPDESVLLPFEAILGMSTQYYTTYEGHEYCLQYKRGWISIERDPWEYESIQLFSQQIGEYTIYDGRWSDEETTVYLTLASDAIRKGRFSELCVPTIEEAKDHPLYRLGLYPSYEVGMICGKTISSNAPYPLPTNNRERKELLRLAKARGWHYHEASCYQNVPACQVVQWIAEHPEEHAALLQEITSAYDRLEQTAANPEEHAALVRGREHRMKSFDRFYLSE